MNDSAGPRGSAPGLANQAAVLAFSRFANYGLMLLSPIILVRLLSVEDFGRYREFLVYASLLQAFAAFSISDSLLYFIPAHPQSPWHVVRQSAALTALTSSLIVVILVAADLLSGGAVVGPYLLPLSIYTLLFVNVDFWERFWLACRRPGAVFGYSSARLIARLLLVILVAALTHDVETIIWSLIGLETVRLLGAAIAWRVLDRAREEPAVSGLWREQLRFCLPAGSAVLLAMATGNLARIVVAKLLGPAALARYTIGTHLEPFTVGLRGSVSQVVLPEMVRRLRAAQGDRLELWKRATVINAVLLFPVVVVLGWYAEPVVVTVFGAAYQPAAAVMQIFLLVVVRECFDFAPALRAANRTVPLVLSNLAGLIVCGTALAMLLPEGGLTGAVLAVVLAKFVDALWLGWSVMRVYGVSLGRVIAWVPIARTAIAALGAAAVLMWPGWTDRLGPVGLVVASLVYLAAYALLLAALRVQEATTVAAGIRKMLSAFVPGKS
ncbi:MAG: lipopolysaccharide biosynthesis protein [Gammaproteobacteria bacterium]